MYKFLLCWRYLRTRYIALASIISVMLGVATMIVVNSVMSGFTTEMQDRIHGILSDVSFESTSLSGMRDAQWHMEQINRIAGDQIEGMTATVAVPAMLSFQCGGQWINRQIQLVGIDERTQGKVSDFGLYLQHPQNREQLSFDLRDGGYDTHDHQAGPNAPERPQMAEAGWTHRIRVERAKAFHDELMRSPSIEGNRPEPSDQSAVQSSESPSGTSAGVMLRPLASGQRLHAAKGDATRIEVVSRLPGPIEPQSHTESAEAEQSGAPAPLPQDILLMSGSDEAAPEPPAGPPDFSNPFAGRTPTDSPQGGAAAKVFDPTKQQHTGLVLGIALATYRMPEGDERFLLLPGDDVQVTVPGAGTPPKGVSDRFTVVDFYESKMSEYDSSLVFVPIRHLQELRGMYEYVGNQKQYFVSAIQIKLKPGADGAAVRDKLCGAFAPELYSIRTWRDKQGALLAAVQMETAILNVLLFLIIAVAGFGILAIFLMIVVEKTRDIGILKSLGASGPGVMGIFVGYGLSLGLVGSGVGTVLGLLFVQHINEIADLLGVVLGQKIFDPSIYYFYEIPTIVNPVTVGWIVVGAIAIAVMASVLPALRAAMLHPVEALRYE